MRYYPQLVFFTPGRQGAVAFPTADDFRRYTRDDTRSSYLRLESNAVERVMLIEGGLLSQKRG